MSDLYSVLRPPPSPVASILVAVGVKNPNNPLAFAIAKEWLRELEKGTSKDGHDQMPLRKVLYRHRNDVYDLPARVQRRGLSHSPCEGEPLLWHAHRSDRVKWARIHKHGAAEVCGFVV